MIAERLRAIVGRRLEAGDTSALARAASRAWAFASGRAIARPLRLPDGVRVIGVGGATLGGAGKTPLAIAITRALAERGERPALVGHAYRARPGRARVVQVDDDTAIAGDDALACARLLHASGAPVVVAPRRQAAIDHAAALGHRVIIVDGLLQASPRRLDHAILTLDAGAPWGSGACPPAGDLRAPRAALLAARDAIAVIASEGQRLDPDLARLGAIPIDSAITGAIDPSGARASIASLGAQRVGLFTTVARPERVRASLVSRGIVPIFQLALADHAAPSERDLAIAARAGVDVWLTTARCATKLPRRIGAAPVLAIEHRLALGALAEALWANAGTDG